MNEKNFEYLKDQVKFTGFGESVETELKDKMQQQPQEFKIYHKADFGQDHAVATLHFKKSDQSDMYFFNRYDLHLNNEKNIEVARQTFYIGKGSNITLKEGYNLMNGRAVNKDLTSKEGQVYNAWVQLNFKETDAAGNYQLNKYHQNYGFDLVKSLEKHPIKELNDEQSRDNLIRSLERGNRQSVTMMQNGSEQKVFIEASPQFKSINIYDGNMQRLGNKQSNLDAQAKGESKSAKQDLKMDNLKQASDEDGPVGPKAAKNKVKKQRQSFP